MDILTSHIVDIMMSHMRTTLTLDPDVAARVRQEVRRTGKAFKAVVNQALRRGLGMDAQPSRAPRFKVQPHALGARPGVDLDRMNQLVDQLEAHGRTSAVDRDPA